MRQFVGLCALVVAVALVAVPAFAEVQNVKVSGDINVRGISRDNYDLRKTTSPGSSSNDDRIDVLLQTTRLRVDADLTDNVAAAVQLANQRFWDADNDASNNIDLNLAYVTLKELVYSPLTVTIGRQDLVFGTGFIVGPGLLGDPDLVFNAASGTLGNTGYPHSAIAREYSVDNGYDAIRATLDFAPLTVDVIRAKITDTAKGHDQNLNGVNLNWKGAPLDRWKGEGELYWFWKNDRAASVSFHDDGAGQSYERNDVHTVGLRTAGEPLSHLWVNAEVAGQFGEVQDTAPSAGVDGRTRQRAALAAAAEATYTFANVQYTPNLGLGWVYYSGEDTGGSQDNDRVGAWDSMFRGHFYTAIQEFLAGADSAGGLYTTLDSSDTAADTNRHLLYVDVGAKPLQDLALSARYTHAWFAERPVAGRDRNAGDEVDVQAKWDYTEDVQVGLLGAVFLPGDYYDAEPLATRSNNAAWNVVGDVTVKF